MTKTTVTETPAERPFKKASEIESGAWVTNVTNVHDEACGPARVEFAKTFHSFYGTLVHLVLAEVDDDQPQTAQLHVDDEVELLTGADVERLKEEGRRRQVAKRLRELADLVVAKELPLPGPYQAPAVSFNLGRDVAALERAAAALGLEVEGRGRTRDLWLTDLREENVLTVHWSAYAPEEPEPAPVPSAAPVEERDGCPVDADGKVVHDLECAEDREMAELDAWVDGPKFGEPGYEGCPGCGKTVGEHAAGCREVES